MESIKANANDALEVQCKARAYTFQLSSRDECERWATNLVALAAAAGYEVPGFLAPEPVSAADVSSEQRDGQSPARGSSVAASPSSRAFT